MSRMYIKFVITWISVLIHFVAQSQLDKGLIAAFYFSGNANDSISRINGTVRGASLATDRFGNAFAAYCFDGVNDYISLGTNSDLKQQIMSISLWVKINNYESNNLNYPAMPFINTRVRESVQFYEAYTIGLFFNNYKFNGSNLSSLQNLSVDISDNPARIDRWYHIVYMFDSDTSYLFLDGKFQQKNHKGFVSTYLSSDSTVLGHVGNNMPDTFKYRNYSWLNGCLDDIKFYNRILNPQEILELYNEVNPKFVGKPSITGFAGFMAFLRKAWPFILAGVVLILIVILAIRWKIKYVRKKEKEEALLQQRFAQMEMKALRSQMNPHFIFNAINSIQHYVLTNEKELANKYLVKFSQLMRNILDLSKQELISLRDELDTIRLYVDIEALRFNNAFNFKMTIAENVNANDIRLPPLLIQPFVENAIWHGLLLKDGDKELNINIFQKDSEVVIEIDDNGIGRVAAEKFSNKELKRRSFGMDITNDRLSVLEKVFGITISFRVLDKTNGSGNSTGTSVIINIKLE